MPTQIVTSAAFGGLNLNILFGTSASLSRDIYTGAILSASAGDLFSVIDLNAICFARKR